MVRQQKVRNALTDIFSDPNSVNPKTGTLNQNALMRIFQVDPATGMKFQQQNLKSLQEQASIEQNQEHSKLLDTQIYQKKQGMINDSNNKALNAYDDAIGRGIPDTQARLIAQEAGQKELSDLKASGLFADNELPQTYSFDPVKARAGALSYKDRLSQQTKQETLKERTRHDLAVEQGGAVQLTDQAKDVMAQLMMKTGQMPSVGWGAAGTKMKADIINRVADQLTKHGFTGWDLAANEAKYKSQTSALRNVTTYVARVNTSINKADMSLDLVKQTAQKGIAGSVPLINRWIQAGRMNATKKSGADVVAFNDALQTFLNEYARVMAGPASNAMLAEGANERAQKMLNNAMTMDGVYAALDVMRKDMQFARQSSEDYVKKLQGDISQGIWKTGPSIGDVMDGYKYKGGDPSLQTSWVKQ